MNPEIESLRRELEQLEEELDTIKQGGLQTPSFDLEDHKEKWREKDRALIYEMKFLESSQEADFAKWEEQMNLLTATMDGLAAQAHMEGETERRFLMQVDPELIALAGRAQASSKVDQVSLDGDTIHESISERTENSESVNTLAVSISKAREYIKTVLERQTKPPEILPPLSKFGIENPPSSRESSLYQNIVINDEVLHSLSMSEREALVFSLINAGGTIESKTEVKLEDLLNISNVSQRLEEVSSIVDEEQIENSKEILNRPVRFKLSNSQSQTNELNKGYQDSISLESSSDFKQLKNDCKEFLRVCDFDSSRENN